MKKFLALILACILGYVLYSLWPTPYSIQRTHDGTIIRTNRFTGSRDEYTDDGWKSLEKEIDLSKRNDPIGIGPASETTGSEPKL